MTKRTKQTSRIKKTKKIYLYTMAVIIILGLTQIIFSSQLATTGKQLKTIQSEINKVSKENDQLKSEIASVGGLIKLKETAKVKGFIKDLAIVNLNHEIPVALKP